MSWEDTLHRIKPTSRLADLVTKTSIRNLAHLYCRDSEKSVEWMRGEWDSWCGEFADTLIHWLDDQGLDDNACRLMWMESALGRHHDCIDGQGNGGDVWDHHMAVVVDGHVHDLWFDGPALPIEDYIREMFADQDVAYEFPAEGDKRIVVTPPEKRAEIEQMFQYATDNWVEVSLGALESAA